MMFAAALLIVLALLEATTTMAFVLPAPHAASQTSPSSITALHAAGGFRPSSKQQDKVAIDPKTGLYRPMKRKQAKKKSLVDGEALASSWEAAKEAVYNGVDGLTELNQKTAEVLAAAPFNKKQNNRDDDSDYERPKNLSSGGVVGGYADIERELGAAATATPKVPLVKNIITDKPAAQEPKPTPVEKLLATKTKALKNKEAAPAEQPLIPPTGLETAREALWSSLDAIQPAAKKAAAVTSKSNKNQSSLAASQTMENAMESFQPAVRARMIASDEFLEALADLDSANPVVRLAAGRRIQALAKQEQAVLQQSQQSGGPNPIDAVKQSFYQAVDAAEATKTTIQDLPRRAQEAYQATVQTTSSAVQAAQKVPDRVEQQVAAMQQSINETVDNTQKTVKEVQALPGRVQSSIQETNADLQRRVKETQETAQRVSQTVSDISTQSKVWLGLEKPKPRPPDTPPPEPLKPADVAWKLLSVSGSLAAEASWFVGKNGAKLAWKASSLAASKGSEVVQAKMKDYQKQQATKAARRKDYSDLQKQQADKLKAYQDKVLQQQADKKKPMAATAKSPSPVAPPAADASEKKAAKTVPAKDPPIPKSIAMKDLAAKQEQQDQDMTALELEIEEALRMADLAIQFAQDEISQEKMNPSTEDKIEGNSSQDKGKPENE